jgi:hypothetical protein
MAPDRTCPTIMNKPIAVKPKPEISFKGSIDKYRSAAVPKITASADEATKAVLAAMKISHGEYLLSVANNRVASCVLSPSSARKIVKATVMSPSMSKSFCYLLICAKPVR